MHINNLTKSKFDDPNALLFRGVTAKLQPADRIALIGGSGTGKSTLLRILSLLESFEEGTIALEDRSSTEWKPHSWRRKVSYVAQKPIMRSGTVGFNLRTVSQLHNLPFDEELARKYMAAVGLGQTDWNKQAGDLSGGEQQRLALVRSLLLQPDILLLDEITSSLDPGSKQAVESLLLEWVTGQSDPSARAYVWITHDLEQARIISNQIWFMADGGLLEQAETGAFFAKPATEQARRFIQGLKEGAKSDE
ncbi:ABC transporter ATP-binding protein [Paenibacillus glycanilyticus]|uniref:ABC transporter ATP-binding protein YjkB n=1 Tax=Paenibacillus glycanilyticus TaxID=126569 RepID=A0ABQ6G9B3_9BACL|nr:ATP-binding cassette domain-containing protein [Paenibacillus glycanilyticus]GLX67554.1 putative ABC transporter ATP-binding protein YjkB [Paenibacillus glycanilyticus]